MPAATTRPRKDYAPRSRPARYPPGGAWPAEMRVGGFVEVNTGHPEHEH